MSDTTKNNKITTLELVMMAMFVAVLSASAYVIIPAGIGNITLLNFFIMIIGLVFSLRDSVIIVAVWMIMGAIGIPVFIGGKAGISYLFGPTGGYTFAFILAVIITCLIRGKKYKRIWYTIVTILMAIFVDLFGMLWLKALGDLSWKQAFFSGFLIFIPLDMVKAVIAAQIVPVFRNILNR